jgi:hypothetical protein
VSDGKKGKKVSGTAFGRLWEQFGQRNSGSRATGIFGQDYGFAGWGRGFAYSGGGGDLGFFQSA